LITSGKKTKKQAIYILFFGGYDITATIIKGVTNAPYVHTALSLTPSLDSIYSFNIKLMLEQLRPYLKNGLYVESIKNYDKKIPYWLYRIEVTHRQYQKIEKIIQKLKKHPNMCSYNIPGALGFLYPEFWENVQKKQKYSFTCSEFIAFMLETSGIVTFDKPLHMIAPLDIINLKQLKQIKKGIVGELQE